MSFASAPSNGAQISLTAVNPTGYLSSTGFSTTVTIPSTTITGAGVYTGINITTLTAGSPVCVNSLVTGFTTPLSGGQIAVVTAITTYAANGQSATVTITVGSGTSGAGNLISSAGATFTPNYPVVNLLIGSALGSISAGQSILGTASLADQKIPTVNAVYSSTIIAVNYTGSIFTTATSGAGPNSYFASISLTFLPSTYLAGIMATSGGLTQAGGTTGAISITNGTLSTAATLGGYFFQTAAMSGAGTTLTKPYVSSSAAGTSITLQYTAANNSGSAITANSQFAIIPQNFTGIGQLSAAQPVVDDASIAVIQLSSVVAASATAVAAGQEIVGLTSYTGPVVVSKVLASSGTFTTGNGVLTLEVSFPNQKSAGSSTSGAGTAIFFIDPSLALGPGVTTSPVPGGNPTYASLQYQCWSNFVYLDQAERDWFAKSTHDLLITQVQRAVIGNSPTQELAFAQPVKFIAFPAVNYSQLYSASSSTAVNYQFKTQINGVDVGESRGLPHWVDVPLYYHTQYGYMHSGTMPTVAVISYCLDTSKLQPTGTLNFSRIDTFRIVTPPVLTNGVLGLCPSIKYPTPYMYAVNYNVLRIQNGTGGLLYAS
jgi:hypothetical protein